MTEDPKARDARKAQRTGLAMARAAFLGGRLGEFNRALLDEALAAVLLDLGIVLSAFPTSDVQRWVPIGPSVTFAEDGREFSRSTGRVRDIAVDATGTRAYAATGKGGVWYTDDSGGTWAPVGGWADRSRTAGGLSNGQACTSLLVSFGATAFDDFVMVGTGELAIWARPSRPSLGGLGVLAAKGPAVSAGVGGDPWEKEAGLALLEGLGVYRLARQPGVVPGSPAAPPDTVLAATSAGLFIGTRRTAVVGPGNEFGWIALPALGAFFGVAKPLVTDVMWLPIGANGRIVVALAKDQESVTVNATIGSGVAYSDDIGATWHWVTGLDPTVAGTVIAGRMSLAVAPGTDRVYVLGDRRVGLPKDNKATVWQVPSMGAATPTATMVTGTPAIWTWIGRSQRDYDQCIAVDIVAGKDRVFLGGSFFDFLLSRAASLWCFDVDPGPAFVPADGVSRTGVPGVGDGAGVAGLIGDDVHADVHIIRLAGGMPGASQVWVGCDGGVYVSAESGRVDTFASRATGFAAIEVNFLSAHPSSSQFLAIGTQDNGRHARLGDVVWQDTVGGDGGGVAIHPIRGEVIVSQTNTTEWVAQPPSGFVNPVERFPGAPSTREAGLSAFYSGAAFAKKSALVARLTLGTNRVWLTDDLPKAFPRTVNWTTLPFPGPALATDPRPGGADPPGLRKTGVPGGGALPAVAADGRGPLGWVVTMKWWSPTDLLVLFDQGVVHWTQDTVSLKWTARVLVGPAGVALVPPVIGAPDPAKTTFTDIGPATGNDFYLVTTGDSGAPPIDTCFFFDSASNTFLATNLRHRLDPNPMTLGPLDPALAVTVDPTSPTDVYVGTVTGVWKGVRTPGVAAHSWTPMVNGLPPAAVQDLGIWVDPAPGPDSPRLLRAAMQARGMWEVNLAAPEPQRTYARVHDHDDRRRLPTPLDDPQSPPGTMHKVFASPDIMVRPKASPAAAPPWMQGAAGVMTDFPDPPPYELWTFQTAFRWIFPSVAADGRWNEAFGKQVARHRHALGKPPKEEIDKDLWDKVVGGTHLSPVGAVTANGADPLAVFRAPWQTPTALTAVGNEADLRQRIVYSRVRRDVAQVYQEMNTVDVLVHHRDTRPIVPLHSFAVLLFREDPSDLALLASDMTAFPAYVRSVLTADNAGIPPPAPPAGWTIAKTANRGITRLNARLDARMPRAVPIDVDLTPITDGNFVLFLAFVGSDTDPFAAMPASLPPMPNVTDLVTRWSPAAARMVQVIARPAPPP